MMCADREIEDVTEDGTIIFVCALTGMRCEDEDLVECEALKT